jgi:hypothetical protein
MSGLSSRIEPPERISNLKRRVERMGNMMNFLAEYRRSALILVLSTLTAVVWASAGAQPRPPKAHSGTTLRPTLFLIAKAIRDAENGKASQAHHEATQALAALDAIAQAETAAEYGKWKKWYRGLPNPRDGRGVPKIPGRCSHPSLPPVLWDGWEAYYHIMHYEGDRSADVK